MRKLSPKIVKSSCVVCAVMALLTACLMEPIDLETFLEDEKIIEIIEKSKIKVGLHADSDPGLIAENAKISNLDASKYYMVEVFNEEMVSQGVKYVSKDGILVNNLNLIGRPAGKAVTSLNNDYTYLVNAAKPLTGSVTFYDTDNSPPLSFGTGSAATISGSMIIPAPDESLFLDLVPALNADKSYSVVSVPVLNPSSGQPSNVPFVASAPAGMLVIELYGEGVTADYVIAEDDGSGAINSFRVLRVAVKLGPLPVAVTLTSIQNPKDNDFVDVATVQFDRDKLSTGIPSDAIIPITITNASSFTSVIWYYDDPGNPLFSGSAYNMNFADDRITELGLNMAGTHFITVEGTRNGVKYSAVVEIEVT